MEKLEEFPDARIRKQQYEAAFNNFKIKQIHHCDTMIIKC